MTSYDFKSFDLGTLAMKFFQDVNYPLVNCHSSRTGKSPFLLGKSTISTGPFSIAMLVITRGYWG